MSSAPIVVQGYSVYSSAEEQPKDNAAYYAEQGAQEGQPYVNADGVQEGAPGDGPLLPEHGHDKAFHDLLWAIVFYVHLAGMIVLITFEMTSNKSLYHKRGPGSVLLLVVTSAFVSIGLSTLALNFMMKYTQDLVRVALIFSIATSLAVAVYAAILQQLLLSFLALLSTAFGVCYAYMVWQRIPFAAANLNTALTAVKQNLGLALIAYIMLALAVVWSVFWLIGFSNYFQSYNPLFLFLLLVSFYWVHQVLQNTVHVTVAGVIGSWWFVPLEASTFCSTALNDSFFRASTYSFGSICFGSLLVAIVQALRALMRITEQNDDCNILTCIIGCILACIQGIVEELNKWAFVYVGLYGMSYLEAGHSVVTLFEHRGWTTIITDDLADNVLFMISLGIGLATGLVGLILAEMNKRAYKGLGNFSDDHIISVAFFFSFLVGYMLASIFMSIVASAVNTVIVCFAEAPAEFQANHPELSAQMRAAWTQAWPELVF